VLAAIKVILIFSSLGPKSILELELELEEAPKLLEELDCKH
jgi:hypothetical protein